ncbi:MAG: DUF3429 domain-containing protein [Rhodospirillales bacterium]
MDSRASGTTRIPPEAKILGVGGLIPVVAGVAVHAAVPEPLGYPLAHTVVVYATLILSFIGGIHWGFASAAFARGPVGSAAPRLLGLSVLPAFVGLGVVLLPALAAAPLLAVAFVGVLLLDRVSEGLGYAPDWWMRLRIQLTGGIVVLLVILTITLAIR